MSPESISYHQMAFALAGADGEADYFIFAFKDIDEAIHKHIQDKEYLRGQLNIMAALSRDYYNIFKIDPFDGSVVIIKLDGYVTKGMEGPGEKKTKPGKEYVSSYRVLDKDEIHYYQFTYLLIDEDNPNEGILAGFKNVDDIVESAREREALAILAETDIMTGILNHGSGKRKVIDALKNGKNIIERIFKKIRKLNIPELAGHEVCMSAGAVIRSVNDSDDFEELYKKVDKSIYKSKEVEGSYITFEA
ncbi:MAG: hypothetical protein K6E13_09680 [Lachnospiraceae bacterium]|nr:hypothetical protein [Lachnospiraceae bacterium]